MRDFWNGGNPFAYVAPLKRNCRASVTGTLGSHLGNPSVPFPSAVSVHCRQSGDRKRRAPWIGPILASRQRHSPNWTESRAPFPTALTRSTAAIAGATSAWPYIQLAGVNRLMLCGANGANLAPSRAVSTIRAINKKHGLGSNKSAGVKTGHWMESVLLA